MKKEPRKPIGRPPLAPGENPARVQVTLPPREYDRADAIARRHGISIPEVLRRGLRVVRDDE
jgi:hypothetical protein